MRADLGLGPRGSVEVRTPTFSSINHNRDDTGAGLSRIEVGADGLLHGELAALIAAKSNKGRSSVLQEGDQRDLDCRSIVTDDGAKLHHTDQTANGGEAA